ncbi:DNA polymerase III subunit gamma/tau [Beggiatoa leptomitoformis]|uniref:DNA polymerase III subunit gamma/tau n=1 Tax=Beggiatoa leptomitoformis TaxID=288004 RepID=A0A2N9YGI5_9GAMM|nr:DNA polymerase III subunit gamma/tau [Beggiatoa leptomitoformis]ALG68030.1 DNA polymerase III subunit gamma/tau [Beggiatoa leptomitoformis]AUI69681.1 DNA polymerase III subunit gamma/tau [Beggiatoa leptomitoformis]
MAYQVLARKWRPHKFPEMVGQTHVVRALTNALDNDRLHHAYLFTGTRGVGKTTIARIFAKSLNCETHGVSSHPCGTCNTCREVDEGRFVDLIEVDAASRTRVEDTRDILENVQYAPTRGRYKVYLIDEVHMLSTGSFNALLKTLEEPPPHVKFLLATTDPQKLPATVLSRCLQFNLKRLAAEHIAQHLENILTTEAIPFEIPALQLLAVAADGSLRDALSLLDQSIAYSGGSVNTDDIRTMLGTLDQHIVVAIVQALADNDAAGLLQQIAQVAEQNPDFMHLLADLLSFLQRIAIAQVVPETVDMMQSDSPAIVALAKQLSPEDVQLFYQIALLGRRDLPLAPEARSGFEMIALRMIAFRPEGFGSLPATRTSTPPRPQPTTPTPVQSSPVQSTPASSASSNLSAVQPPNNAVAVLTEPVALTNAEEWTQILQTLAIQGFVKQLAVNCAFEKRDGNLIHLVLANSNQALANQSSKLEQALQQHCDANIHLRIRVGELSGDTPALQQKRQQAENEKQIHEDIHNDPFVQAVQEHFSGQVRRITKHVS